MGVFSYLFTNSSQVLSLLAEHVQLTTIAVLIAMALGIPLGILIHFYKKLSSPILGCANLIQAIPSMALLGLAIPLLGIGWLPAIVVVILYSLLPIIKNTYIGLSSINPETVEAAQGIGMTKAQILRQVQLPMALPIIMAGVRISAVTAVGLMTIAAFIGAGGLGFLVFSGISTTNNSQIIAGAIPAAILALIVDYVLSIVENIVTPGSLLKDKPSEFTLFFSKTTGRKALFLSGLAAFLVLILGFNSLQGLLTSKKDTITVGGKNFTEQYILVHLISDLIEDRTDLKVIRKDNLGGTQVAFNALKRNDLQIYVDYTGTVYADTLRYKTSSDAEKVYKVGKKDLKDKFDIDMLTPFSFNNTYALGIREETANTYQLSTVSDLVKVSDQLVMGASLEFLNREDGILGIKKAYNMTFKEEKGIDGSNKYVALTNHETDIIDAFTTDGLLLKYKLKLLDDDRSFFPSYYAVPLLSSGTLEKHPALEGILQELGKKLDMKTMTELNYQVDVEQKNPAAVAHDFLVREKMITEP